MQRYIYVYYIYRLYICTIIHRRERISRTRWRTPSDRSPSGAGGGVGRRGGLADWNVFIAIGRFPHGHSYVTISRRRRNYSTRVRARGKRDAMPRLYILQSCLRRCTHSHCWPSIFNESCTLMRMIINNLHCVVTSGRKIEIFQTGSDALPLNL